MASGNYRSNKEKLTLQTPDWGRRRRNPPFGQFDIGLVTSSIRADGTGYIKGNTIGPGEYLQGADLIGANLTGANLAGADLKDADLIGANLTGANLEGADLTDANLRGADLRGAYLGGAKLAGVNWEDALLPDPPQYTRSYGVMTGPILKIGKPDSPDKAADFKRRYPAEFERLKGDTAGRDFTKGLRESLREKYRTPFDWAVTKSIYHSGAQRLSDKPNKVMLLNVDTKDVRYTPQQSRLLGKLAQVAPRTFHPRARGPFLTMGWIRYAQDDDHGVLLIEEVQSDVETFLRQASKDRSLLSDSEISSPEYAEVVDLLHPYSERFYEDAVGLIYQEAEALGYTVEMLGYGDKEGCFYVRPDGKRVYAPRSIYTDLPKRLGMLQKRESEVPTKPPLRDRVSYYKPNPGIPPRYRQECCVCGDPASLMSGRGDVFCEDCF